MIKGKPKYLYKYRPINMHTLSMILFNEAYFSSPPDLNDPFDCNIIPQIDYTNLKIFIDARRAEGKISQKEYDELLENPVMIMEHGFRETIENIRNNLKIFCLSEINNNVMMYSHYADSHKGICLEFLVSDDPFFEYLDNVRYTENIPIFHGFNEDIRKIQNELKEIEVLIKSLSWLYEQEWRIITDDLSHIKKFSPNILTSIIFGYQTSNNNRLLIERIIERKNPKIQLKEAIKKDKSFELEIRPYKT
jgi:hypothetical protein